MTYQDRENSTAQGEPAEFYLFDTEDQSWRLTSADADQTLDAELYLSITLSRSEISDDQEQRRGSVNVMIDPNHEIASLFTSYIPDTPLLLRIKRNHLDEADGEAKLIFNGRVNQCIFGDPCTLICVPDTDDLKKQIPSRTYQTPCNHILYDAGCGIDREDFKRTITIETVSADGLTVTSTDYAGEADGWFTNGYIEKGKQRRMIVQHVGNTVILIAPMNGLSVDDVTFAFAGCNRDFPADCITKFNNGARFMGFKWVPKRNPFVGSITQSQT